MSPMMDPTMMTPGTNRRAAGSEPSAAHQLDAGAEQRVTGLTARMREDTLGLPSHDIGG